MSSRGISDGRSHARISGLRNMLNKFGKNGAPFARDKPYTRNGRMNHSAELLRLRDTTREVMGRIYTRIYRMSYAKKCWDQQDQKNAETNKTRKILGPTRPEKCWDQHHQKYAGTNNTRKCRDQQHKKNAGTNNTRKMMGSTTPEK